MVKNKIGKTISILSLISCSIIAMLYTITGNGFKNKSKPELMGIHRRLMLDSAVSPQHSFELNFDIDEFVVRNGKLYVSNSQEKTIYILDSLGNILRNVGRKGSAPGEFQGMMNISVWGNDTIRIIDHVQSAIIDIDDHGKVLRVYKYDKRISRGISVSPELCMIKNDDPGTNNEETFEVVNVRTNQKSVVKARRLPESQEITVRDMQVDGNFFSNNQDYFLRLSYRTGQFITFDNTGKFLYLQETVDATPPPKVHLRTVGNMNVLQPEANARTVNYHATADSKYLYILSNAASPLIKDIRQGITDERVVDIYNLKDGNYQRSFILPKFQGKRCSQIKVSSNGLYAVYKGNTIVRYTLNLKSEKL